MYILLTINKRRNQCMQLYNNVKLNISMLSSFLILFGLNGVNDNFITYNVAFKGYKCRFHLIWKNLKVVNCVAIFTLHEPLVVSSSI